MISKNQVKNPAQSPEIRPSYITPQINFIFRARMLWRDLATWLRAYMISLYGGVGNTAEISERLLRIPMEYGNILRVFFGDQATEQYMKYLTQYITIFQSFLDAQHANDINAANVYIQQLYQNITASSTFLASLNPYWSIGEWQYILESFTNLQIQEATTFLTNDYTTNINIFDRILALTTIIGDYFSEGLTYYFL